jgi:hypothetical protein
MQELSCVIFFRHSAFLLSPHALSLSIVFSVTCSPQRVQGLPVITLYREEEVIQRGSIQGSSLKFRGRWSEKYDIGFTTIITPGGGKREDDQRKSERN